MTNSKSNKNCECKYIKYLITIIAVALTTFIYDFIVHGILLEKAYLLRNKEEMGDNFLFYIFYHLLFSALIVSLFKCFVISNQNKNSKHSLKFNCFKFGLLIGSFLGFVQGSFYIYMSITTYLTFAWFFGAVIQGFFIGGIIYFLNRKNK